jgi:hypothetical protein
VRVGKECMTSWKGDPMTPISEAVPCEYKPTAWAYAKCKSIYPRTSCPYLHGICDAVYAAKKETEEFADELGKSFLTQSHEAYKVDHNQVDKKMLDKLTLLNLLDGYKQTHLQCDLWAKCNKLARKREPHCNWDENQYKWNKTVAENCEKPGFEAACKWLTSKAGTPKPSLMIKDGQLYDIKSVGCFKDSRKRAMPVKMRGRHNTVQQCAEFASNKGYEYFGVQYGGYCFTGPGHTYDSQGKAKDSDCTYRGKSGIGGGWRNSVYQLAKAGGKIAPFKKPELKSGDNSNQNSETKTNHKEPEHKSNNNKKETNSNEVNLPDKDIKELAKISKELAKISDGIADVVGKIEAGAKSSDNKKPTEKEQGPSGNNK